MMALISVPADGNLSIRRPEFPDEVPRLQPSGNRNRIEVEVSEVVGVADEAPRLDPGRVAARPEVDVALGNPVS